MGRKQLDTTEQLSTAQHGLGCSKHLQIMVVEMMKVVKMMKVVAMAITFMALFNSCISLPPTHFTLG